MSDQSSKTNRFIEAARTHPFYRACFFIGIPISISFLLGFAFILIIQGLVFGFLWLAPYWSVTYQFLRKKLNFPSVNPQVTNIPITWWRIPIIGVKVFFSLAMIYYGLKILFAQGFLHQNLLWLLFSSNWDRISACPTAFTSPTICPYCNRCPPNPSI